MTAFSYLLPVLNSLSFFHAVPWHWYLCSHIDVCLSRVASPMWLSHRVPRGHHIYMHRGDGRDNHDAAGRSQGSDSGKIAAAIKTRVPRTGSGSGCWFVITPLFKVSKVVIGAVELSCSFCPRDVHRIHLEIDCLSIASAIAKQSTDLLAQCFVLMHKELSVPAVYVRLYCVRRRKSKNIRNRRQSLAPSSTRPKWPRSSCGNM